MIQITIAQAQAIINSPIFGMRLPVAVGYKFSKLGKQIQGELKTAQEETSKLIQACHGVLSKDEKTWHFEGEDSVAFYAGIQELEAQAFGVENFPMDLERLGSVELSPAELIQLEPLFDMPANPEPAN
jgi:hypothetical protein